MQAANDRSHRLQVFLHAVFFVLGFGLVFTILGSAAGLLGRSLNIYLPLLQRFGAIMLVIFGLATLGVFRRLSQFITQRVDLNRTRRRRRWSASSPSSTHSSTRNAASRACTR